MIPGFSTANKMKIRSTLVRPIDVQIVKNIPASEGIRRCFTVFTTVRFEILILYLIQLHAFLKYRFITSELFIFIT
jgi:hypothetical protein